jgi:hypothetical protein
MADLCAASTRPDSNRPAGVLHPHRKASAAGHKANGAATQRPLSPRHHGCKQHTHARVRSQAGPECRGYAPADPAYTTFFACNAAMSPAPYPSSDNTASVCSPASGVAERTDHGVRLNSIA